MIIGIDVDGVITDLFSFMNSECEKFATEHKLNFVRNENGTNSREMFGWDEREDCLFWGSNLFKYAENAVEKPLASEIIKKLKQDGHTIIIITSRTYCTDNDERGEKSRDILIKWLLKNDIYFDELYFTNEIVGKVPQINKCKIDIFIDDSIRNLKEIAEEIPVICMNEPYNKTFYHKNMTRCQTWQDIYQVISQKNK